MHVLSDRIEKKRVWICDFVHTVLEDPSCLAALPYRAAEVLAGSRVAKASQSRGKDSGGHGRQRRSAGAVAELPKDSHERYGG